MTKNFTPKVTIMIPTFNQEAFIGDAIGSALAQSYPNLEVIVGDDASTDGTANIAMKIQDPRLSCVRNPCNLGRTANYRNLLYNYAAGDYVINLDGDDYFTDQDFIAYAIQCIGKKKETVMVVARVTTKTPNGEWVSEIPGIQECTGLQLLSKLPKKEYMLMHMGVLYSRKHALVTGFYRSDAISSDWESLYRLSLKGIVRYLDRNIGVWRQHASNETGTNDVSKLLANLRIWEPVYNDAYKSGMTRWRSMITSTKCVANYASSSCIRISISDKSNLLGFILSVAKEFWLPTFFFVIYPKYGARVFLSFCGYYRRRHQDFPK